MALRIYLANDLPGRHIIHYTLQLIAFNKNADFAYVSATDDADLRITSGLDSDIPLSYTFYQYLTDLRYEAVRELAKGSYHFYTLDGKKDLLASIFYLTNSIQEYDTRVFDQYGRYPYKESVQCREGFLEKNLVQELINSFLASHPALARVQSAPRKSSFFLTHDIDTVYGAKNQNGDHAIKTKQYSKIPKLLYNHYLGTPDWINMDRIMALEDSYGFKSTFYWLVTKDKRNADYAISEAIIQRQLSHIRERGFEIGLHKSLSDTSLADEMLKLDVTVAGQRYHFLKFNLPQAYDAIEAADLKLDTSLGFSEAYGFRNSYGLPIRPLDLRTHKVYDMIEVPMNVMDGSFFYQGKTVAEAERDLIAWLDANKTDAVITINWHNNFFDDMLYAGYDKLYETILRYFKEEGFACMTQASLIKEYKDTRIFLS